MAVDHPDFPEDLRLVRRAMRAEVVAIEQLAQRLRCVPRILGAWNARLGRPLDDHDLADLVQDVVVIILQKLDEYAGRAPFEAWIYKICRLELMNGVRRKRRRRHAELDVEPAADSVAVDGGSTDFELLHRALERLGGVEADTIRLKHFDALTFDEIGVRLDIPSNTAKTRYYRGLVKLERLLRGMRAFGEEGSSE